MELNGLAVRLQAECNPKTCTQMTATEQWIFLCAAHKTPKEVIINTYSLVVYLTNGSVGGNSAAVNVSVSSIC